MADPGPNTGHLGDDSTDTDGDTSGHLWSAAVGEHQPPSGKRDGSW